MFKLRKSNRPAIGQSRSGWQRHADNPGFFELRRQRRVLSQLEPHLLFDIGLTEAERAREVRRIF